MPDLQTILSRLLEEDSQTAVVGMLTSAKLSFICKSVRWIAKKFQEPDKMGVLISPNPSPSDPKLNNLGFPR